MTADEDAGLIDAAETIRHELKGLVPEDADALGAELDLHITRARAADASERSEAVDGILELLTKRRTTQRRLDELLPAADAERGVPEDFWAWNQTLAGKPVSADPDPNAGNMVQITCLECQYVNKLPFRPPADDPGDCQNPDEPKHMLKMA